MNRILQLLLVCFIIVACADATKNKPKNEGLEKSIEIDFPLDSLLHFDSESELKTVFGEFVERGIMRFPESEETHAITLLFPGSENEVVFTWEDDTLNFNKLVYLQVSGKNSDWKTKEGLALGTSIEELESFNKKPFTFYGLEWDYSGEIQWDDGYLDEREIYGRLKYPDNGMPDEFNALIGDHKIKSSSEVARKANLILTEITMMK